MASLELDVLMNTRDVQRGAKDVDKALDGVSDSLDDVARDGEQAGDKLERSFRDAADAAKRESRTIESDVQRNVNRGFDRASAGAENFKDEAKQNAAEVAASFDGSAESIADGVQGLAATAFSGFGPAGIAAGVTAAAGIGLVTQALTTAQEQADELKQRLADAYRSAAEEGRNDLDEAEIIAAANDIIFDKTLREEYQRDARAIGIDSTTFIRAMVGDREALTIAIRAGAEAEAAARAETEGMVSLQGEALANYNHQLIAAEKVNDKLEQQSRLVQENVNAANVALELSGADLIQIQKRNDELARTPSVVHTRLEVDDADLEEKLSKSRSLRVNIDAYSGRTGQRIL